MNNQASERALRALERSETPFVLYPDDIGIQFHISPDQARTAMRMGLFGPFFLVRGEPAVLRGDLEQHLRFRTVQKRKDEREILGQLAGSEVRVT